MDITARACMFAHYSEAIDKSKNDVILVKERIRDAAGNERSNIRFIENFERPFYITKKGARNHNSKREYEVLENLDAYRSTQARLPYAVARALGVKGTFHRLSDLANSPYLYGTDIPPESLIKHQYRQKYPTYQPEASVAALDFETNVFSSREEIVMGAVSFKDRTVLAVTRDFLKGMPDEEAIARYQKAFDLYLGEYKASRNLRLHVVIADNDLGVVRTLFGALHKWQPDIVSIWNMPFDINKTLESLNYHGVDPAIIFSHPKLPSQYKRFKWREGKPQKTTATGKTSSKHVADLWHTVEAPSSFYIIDSMCFFKRNRVTEAARHSYSLDAILEEELKLGKLRFKEAEAYHGLEWHKFMQTHHPIEYGIYNIFDCIALELLDESTHDLSRALLASAGISPIRDVSSGPRNLANNLHFFLEEQGKIICSTASTMWEKLDELPPNMENWILTLPSELNVAEGQRFISDLPMESRLYTQIFDIDIASGYPNSGVIGNVCKETRLREICGIGDLPEIEQRRCGVNLTAIKVNAIDLAQTLYQAPTLDETLTAFKRDMGLS